MPEQNVMREGTIKCDCGQEFYFETTMNYIDCIKCKKRHDVKSFPIKEVEAGGTDV
jgi:Zn finger protein HypA/HybF involved in hydrogenase expression